MIVERAATRKVWRDQEDIKIGRQTYKVPFEMLVPGWNPRQDFEGIEELAADIQANGMHEAIRGDLAADGKSFVMMDGGGRRYRALLHLRSIGIPIDEVEVMPLPIMDTPSKILFILSTGVSKALFKPMEVAAGITKLKEETGWSNSQIADKMGRSRQWVDNMVKITTLPDEVQHGINEGTVKPTNALHNRTTSKREEIITQTNNTNEFYDGPKYEGKDDEPIEFDKNDLHIPEQTSLEQEMIGILPKAKVDYREPQLDVKELEKEIDDEEISLRNPEVKKVIKNMRNLCAKLEGVHRGLPQQSQAHADQLLLWVRNDLNELEMILKTNLKR